MAQALTPAGQLLKTYLTEREITDTAFGEEIGVARNNLWEYMVGKHTPTIATARKIRDGIRKHPSTSVRDLPLDAWGA